LISKQTVAFEDNASSNCSAMASDSLRHRGTHIAPAAAAKQASYRPSKCTQTSARSAAADNLDREVYGILGVPIDATDMITVLHKAIAAATDRSIFFISTVNLNYLVTSLTDADFRESLLLSDLCPADGMPVVWIARFLGIPIKGRVAGSDMFDALRLQQRSAPLKVFLFGGQPNVAATACDKINAQAGSLRCVGSLDPGFGSVDDMSTDTIIDVINASQADFLAVALGAKKGQAWLLRNHSRLEIPVRAHLGATINFQAGTVKRAPRWMRSLGVEWLWRIWEEPQLWRRYMVDGLVLLRLVVTRILPLAVFSGWQRFRLRKKTAGLVVDRADDNQAVRLFLRGTADADHVNVVIPDFRRALTENRPIVINLAATRYLDSRFLGLLLMLDQQSRGQGGSLTFAAVPPQIRRIFRFNGFEFLLRRAERA
jgi:N-acetylglucosaminyldiphosphoundecaprenol N-acetyl-beta-D-mannosaminyltransferase